MKNGITIIFQALSSAQKSLHLDPTNTEVLCGLSLFEDVHAHVRTHVGEGGYKVDTRYSHEKRLYVQ